LACCICTGMDRKIDSAGGAPETAVFTNCLMRVTGRRIIIARKMLFGKTYALRHVVTHDAYSDGIVLSHSLRKGFLNFTVNRSKVRIEQDSERRLVTIPIPVSLLTPCYMKRSAHTSINNINELALKIYQMLFDLPGILPIIFEISMLAVNNKGTIKSVITVPKSKP